MAQKTDKIGKLFLVDPNPPGTSKIPEEDLFIYVSLIARAKNRGVGESLDPEEGRIRFISTEIPLGESTANNGGKSYATTDYTNIGGLASQDSEGSLEGFGITNISIKYGASLVPQVDISFVDLRGSALFDVLQEEGRNMAYGAFFQLPYPIFELKLKGYFGNTITYCLHMLSWAAKFDSSSGNFNIDGKFVGFQQAFLADMSLGNVIGTVNTTKGRANLEPLKIVNSLNPKQPENTPPLDRFLITLSELPIRFIKIKDQDKEYQKFRELTNLQAKLKNILDLIGLPMKKDTEGLDPDMQFYKQPNNPTQTLTTAFDEDDLANKVDYLSIRDWIIIKKGVSARPSVYFGQFLRTLHSLIDDYNIFIETNKDELLINQSEIKFDTYDGYDKSGLIELSTAPAGTGGYYNFIDDGIPASFKITSDATFFRDIKIAMSSPVGTKSLYARLKEPGRNDSFKPEIEFDNKFWGSTQKEFTKSDSVLVFVYDFSKMKQIVNTIWNLVKKERLIREEEINKNLNEQLSKDIGFNPTIQYVFSVLCNNVQAMLATQFEVALEAHKKRKSRNSELKNYSSMTDLPRDEDGNAISYPWPSLHVANAIDGTVESKYIGNNDIFPNLTKENFPEIKFIEEFLQNYITKKAQVRNANQVSAKVATGGRDTDNWYPINPIDFRDNPYFDLITEVNIVTIEKKISEILALRAIVSKNYSNYKNHLLQKSLEDLGKLEGINAEKTLFNKDGSNLTLVKLISASNFTVSSLIGKLIQNRYLINIGNNEYRLKESSGVNATNHKISGKSISGYRNKNADFILLGGIDEVNEIWNNTSSLWSEITKNKNGNPRKAYQNLEDKTPSPHEQNPVFYKKSHNNVQNLCYKVWVDDVNAKLEVDQAKKLKNFSISDISLIDGGPNISDPTKNTASGGLTFASRKYINILRSKNVNASPGNTLKWEVKPQLTDSLLYTQQLGKHEKALLLLNTLPFNTFDNTILDLILDSKYNYGKIILLPKYYLYWIGGTLWRYLKYQVSGNDPIKWGPNNVTLQFNVTTFDFIHTIGNQAGYKAYTEDDSLIGDSLLSLPSNIIEKFINYFTRWVESETADNDNFDNFELTVKEYSNSADIPGAKGSAQTLVKWLGSSEKIVLAAPDIFDPTTFKSGLKISHDELTSYMGAFMTEYKNQNDVYQKAKKAEKVKTKDLVKDPDLQLSVYNYFKNIYNKWIGGTINKEDLVYNACGTPGRDLIKYFHFINRSWGDIGEKAVINLKSLSSLSDNMDSNIYFLMSKILRDNNFLFQILPNYVNFKNPEDVKTMFRPQFTLEETEDKNSGPSYICIYCGGNSESVDIVQENRSYAYPNDSFLIFENPTAEFTKLEDPFDAMAKARGVDSDKNKRETVSMVAFRVAFGTENQSIFKDVSLDQSEFRETAEYFSTLSELIDKRGGTQRVFKGTDLLKVFKTRSYKCGVESLGCMSIQPLMYFQLDNVPFFNGTYLITDVNHTINGNHMTTNFSGLRQSTFVTPLVDTYTTFLDLDFNEISEEPPPFTNLNDNDSTLTLIGVLEELSSLPFNPDFITKTTLLELDIDEDIVDELFIVPIASTSALIGGTGKETYFELILKSFGIKRNDQVVFFLSQIRWNSNNLKNTSNTDIPEGTAVISGGNTQTWGNGQIKYMPNRSANLDGKYGPAGQGYVTDIDDNDQWIKLYRYRQRGYLNLIGKSNYTTAVADTNVIKYISALFPTTPPNLIMNPDAISDSTLLSFVIAAHVFTTKTLKLSKLPAGYKDGTDAPTSVLNKTCNQISGDGNTTGGSPTRYQLVSQILKDQEAINPAPAFESFKEVLNQLTLLSYTNLDEI